jgi:hypothetical protein
MPGPEITAALTAEEVIADRYVVNGQITGAQAWERVTFRSYPW